MNLCEVNHIGLTCIGKNYTGVALASPKEGGRKGLEFCAAD